MTNVVETDVHFPTDINLLFDAVRKMISLAMILCFDLGLSDWRQGKDLIRRAKRLFRQAARIKRSNSKNKDKKAEREQLIINAHLQYIELAQSYVEKIRQTVLAVQPVDPVTFARQ